MKGKSILFSGKFDVAIGDVNFMPKTGEKSKFAKYIANRPDIDPNGSHKHNIRHRYNHISTIFNQKSRFSTLHISSTHFYGSSKKNDTLQQPFIGLSQSVVFLPNQPLQL